MADLNNGIFYSFLERSGFNGSEPYFYNTTDFPWVKHLEDNWMVIAEGIQVILRREGYPQPYEALKALTRGRHLVSREHLHDFIDTLEIAEEVKEELKRITPHNYVGA